MLEDEVSDRIHPLIEEKNRRSGSSLQRKASREHRKRLQSKRKDVRKKQRKEERKEKKRRTEKSSSSQSASKVSTNAKPNVFEEAHKSQRQVTTL